MRGSADAYEFEEDRLSLAQQGGAGAALEQTVEVLESVLGTEVLLSGHCVQGLLAFSSLAYDAKTASTTIDPTRNRDLVIQQRNYLKYFGSTRQMYEFSQIKAVAQVLHSRIDTFRDDIVESNKIKVRELLAENLTVLHECLNGHRAFMLSIEPEFEKCRSAFDESLKSFKRLVYAGRKTMSPSTSVRVSVSRMRSVEPTGNSRRMLPRGWKKIWLKMLSSCSNCFSRQ